MAESILEFVRVNTETIARLQELLEPLEPIKKEEAHENPFKEKNRCTYRNYEPKAVEL